MHEEGLQYTCWVATDKCKLKGRRYPLHYTEDGTESSVIVHTWFEAFMCKHCILDNENNCIVFCSSSMQIRGTEYCSTALLVNGAVSFSVLNAQHIVPEPASWQGE